MKLMILSATHQVAGERGPVYEFFLRRMAHIRNKYGIEMLVVGNEGDISKDLTEKYGHLYLEYPNNPVSNKWNAGMLALKEHNPTHVMIMGSDDFVDDALIEKFISLLSTDDYNVVGIIDSYYSSYNTGRAHFGMCLYWPGYPKGEIIGYCRTFSREILDAVDWAPWPLGLNAGLDRAASSKIKHSQVAQRPFKFSIREEGCFHIDIKTRANISSIAPIVRRSTELNLDLPTVLRTYLPEDEVYPIIGYLETLVHDKDKGR